MKSKGVLQDLIPDVEELELAQVPAEGWIIDPYEQGFLDGPGNAVCLPTHNGKNVHTDKSIQKTDHICISLSPKVLPNSPMYSSSQPAWVHLNL